MNREFVRKKKSKWKIVVGDFYNVNETYGLIRRRHLTYNLQTQSVSFTFKVTTPILVSAPIPDNVYSGLCKCYTYKR
jgi:hypothetical protein